MITEMRGADLIVFELSTTVMTVIQCFFEIFFELIKTVMVINSLAGHFFEITDVFFFFNRHHRTTANAQTQTLTEPTKTTKTSHTTYYPFPAQIRPTSFHVARGLHSKK